MAGFQKSVCMGGVVGGGVLVAVAIGLAGSAQANAAVGYDFLFDGGSGGGSVAGIAQATAPTGGESADVAEFISGEQEALQDDPAYTTDAPYQAAGENVITAQQGLVSSLDQFQNSWNDLSDALSQGNWGEMAADFAKIPSVAVELGSAVTELIAEGIKFDEASPEDLTLPMVVVLPI